MEPGENKKVLAKDKYDLSSDNVLTLGERGTLDGFDPFKIIAITATSLILEQADTQNFGDVRTFGFTVIL